MSAPGSIMTSTHFSEILTTALNEFHQALTKRWTEEAWRESIRPALAGVTSDVEFPTWVSDPVTSRPLYFGIGDRAGFLALWMHIGHGHCGFAAWVEGGQEGPLSAVSCEGRTGSDGSAIHFDLSGLGQDVVIPPYIACGIGSIFRQIESWAWTERAHVWRKLPLFDHHDLVALEAAHDEFIGVGKQLGLEPAAESFPELAATFTPVSERELDGTVATISGRNGVGLDWWAGWTGLAAARARSGFFDSIAPTAQNQSGILGSLANLYSDRASIIVKGRNDALYWIQWATGALAETELVMSDRADGWKAVEGIGMGISVGAPWAGPVVSTIGASVKLIGWLGGLLPGSKREVYVYEIVEVIEKLNNKVTALNEELAQIEQDYADAVAALNETIYSIHSYNLELYDITANNPAGDRQETDTGFDANIDSILQIAEECYNAGMHYEGLLRPVAATVEADSNLADQDGKPTDADTSLLAIRDRLHGFLRTTCGRYLVAGDQVVASAEDYVAVDTDQRDVFNRTVEDWAETGVGYQVDFVPTDYATSTDRPDGAGEGDGEDYVTDEEVLPAAR